MSEIPRAHDRWFEWLEDEEDLADQCEVCYLVITADNGQPCDGLGCIAFSALTD